MSRKQTKKQKQQVIKYESNNMSQDQMIEIQAEAYYRALKRIEDEKVKLNEQKPEKQKLKLYEKILFCLNVFLWPWIINKRFIVNNRIYDSIPVIFVSAFLRLSGGFMWLVGLAGFACAIYNLNVQEDINEIINNFITTFSISFVLLSFGSIFILAGGEFEKETDSSKIYAYSASIIALVSCIVSVISLLS